MRQRAREAFEQKVRRGHYLWEPPVNFVRTEDQRIEKSPDRQVQEAITGLFRNFREFGTSRRTMLWYCDEQVPLREAVAGTSDAVWAAVENNFVNTFVNSRPFVPSSPPPMKKP
jgi:hypothetical protein